MACRHHNRPCIVLTGLLAALLWMGQVAADGYRQFGDAGLAQRAESGLTSIIESERGGTGRAFQPDRPSDPLAPPSSEASSGTGGSKDETFPGSPATTAGPQAVALPDIRAPPARVNVA